MKRRRDPQEYGLPARTIIEQIDPHTVALLIDRKSRIIMADGKKVLEKVKKIKHVRPAMVVALKTSAPVCSKTKKFLEAEGIQLISI
ncbi:MAG: hypothetical protein HKP41_11850 [Desulfobacterales bacterium]|nr:hypothetical protein [Deltaproteobacteria bacterium]NNK95034.1 hypothetical protein [Desulfobacterales bacterium]